MPIPDVSRTTFDYTKNYSEVIIQQGKPGVDAEINELQDIQNFERRQLNKDLMTDGFMSTGFLAVGTAASNALNIMATGTTIVPVDSTGVSAIVGRARVNNWRIDIPNYSGDAPFYAITGDHHVLTGFTTPATSDRTDLVYLKAYLETVNSSSTTPDHDASIIDPTISSECAIRYKVKYTIEILAGIENGSKASPTLPVIAGYYMISVANIDRRLSDPLIQAADVHDLRVQCKLIPSFDGTTGHSHTGGLHDGPQITTAGIADGAITNTKLAASSIVRSNLSLIDSTNGALAIQGLTKNYLKNGSGFISQDYIDNISTASVWKWKHFAATSTITAAPRNTGNAHSPNVSSIDFHDTVGVTQYLQQKVVEVSSIAGQIVTFSCWVKMLTNVALDYHFSIGWKTTPNTESTFNNLTASFPAVVSPTISIWNLTSYVGSFVRVACTFVMPNPGTDPLYFLIRSWGNLDTNASTANACYIDEAQLCVGDMLTQYEEKEIITPVGTVIDRFFVPNGYVECAGQTISRSPSDPGGNVLYDDIVDYVTAAYSGHGGDQANMPNLQNKFIVGAGDTYDAGDVGADSLATVTLDLTMIPSHDHTPGAISSGGHTHRLQRDLSSSVGGSDAAIAINQGVSVYGYVSCIEGAGAHTHSITPAGGGLGHNNLPPYHALRKCMKY